MKSEDEGGQITLPEPVGGE